MRFLNRRALTTEPNIRRCHQSVVWQRIYLLKNTHENKNQSHHCTAARVCCLYQNTLSEGFIGMFKFILHFAVKFQKKIVLVINRLLLLSWILKFFFATYLWKKSSPQSAVFFNLKVSEGEWSCLLVFLKNPIYSSGHVEGFWQTYRKNFLWSRKFFHLKSKKSKSIKFFTCFFLQSVTLHS